MGNELRGGKIKTEIGPGVWLETHSKAVARARGSDDPAEKGKALLSASLAPSTAEIAAILEAGADPNYSDSSGGPALTNLAFHEQGRFVEMLLAAGADPRGKSPDGDEPLHLACRNNALNAAKRLLGAGADPNALGKDGRDPLELALGKGFDPVHRSWPGIRPDLLQALFDAGAEVRRSHLEQVEALVELEDSRGGSWLSDSAKAAAEMVRRQLEAAEICAEAGVPAPGRTPSI